MTGLRLGTRASRLALSQSRAVARVLEGLIPGLRVEIVEIRTSGDRIKEVPLGPHLGQSFFTKEIEDALLEGRIDLAVHSCKDLASQLPPGLVIGAVPLREDPRDALVGAARLADLPRGARVGTASVRRKRFLAAVRPDLSLEDLRGNVPTRVRAVDQGRMDAVVLAVAGLRRLGLDERIGTILSPDVLPPAAGQGALAVEIREDDSRAREMVETLDHPSSRSEITAERACLRRLGAGCQAPVGVLGRSAGTAIELVAAVAGPDGIVRARRTGESATAAGLGGALAEDLLRQLEISTLRDTGWAGPPPRQVEAP